MPNVRKMEITIDFISMVTLLIHCRANIAEIFTDILKHCFLQTNISKFMKSML